LRMATGFCHLKYSQFCFLDCKAMPYCSRPPLEVRSYLEYNELPLYFREMILA
jgi:hypothetical protein